MRSQYCSEQAKSTTLGAERRSLYAECADISPLVVEYLDPYSEYRPRLVSIRKEYELKSRSRSHQICYAEGQCHMSKFYDDKYGAEESYWGKLPSSMARLLFQRYLPRVGEKLLDVGCGEGRDSIFFARNGYLVSGFDSSSEGVKKSLAWADELRLSIDFFKADVIEYRLQDFYDVVFSSGALHYIPPPLREEILSNYKRYTTAGGLHAHMVPIHKPFVPMDPQADDKEQTWRSGELLTYYHDWKIEFFTEQILDDVKSGYKLPVNRLIAREPSV